MNGIENTVVRDLASGVSIFSTVGPGAGAAEASRVAGYGMARRMEPSCSEQLDDAACQQPADELRRLYATIADLRERLAAHGETATLGAADVVLLRAMSEPMTRRQLAAATRMSAGYLHVRLHRLHAMGHVQKFGQVSRAGRGKGQGEWIWRKTPNAQA